MRDREATCPRRPSYVGLMGWGRIGYKAHFLTREPAGVGGGTTMFSLTKIAITRAQPVCVPGAPVERRSGS